jgi:DNA-binding response OmpR family regulator
VTSEILLVEDDLAVGDALSRTLESEGYDVRWAHDGTAAVSYAVERLPDLVVLDLGLPDIDGVEVCRQVRSFAGDLPIIALTARGSEIDIVVGLDAGADDYVTKPFRLAELLARIRARLRKAPTEADTIAVGALRVDPASRRVFLNDTEIELRPREFDLLYLLGSEAGRAVTRERIMDEVWDEYWGRSTKTLDVHISSIRRKLAGTRREPGPRIVALRGIGYRLDP